jgi:hypothetical protein
MDETEVLTLKLLRQTEMTAHDIRELIEIGRQLAATGNIRGPVPPKLEALVKLMNEAIHEIKAWLG